MDTALLETLELLTPAEQKVIPAIAEYLKSRRAEAAEARVLTEALLAEIPGGEPRFATPDEGISPARRAARRFMRENPTLMHPLAQQAGGDEQLLNTGRRAGHPSRLDQSVRRQPRHPRSRRAGRSGNATEERLLSRRDFRSRRTLGIIVSEPSLCRWQQAHGNCFDGSASWVNGYWLQPEQLAAYLFMMDLYESRCFRMSELDAWLRGHAVSGD